MTRPALDVGGQDMVDATDAVAAFVAELQSGWDRRDADLTDRRLAADVVWGSPFGATVEGFGELHAIHARLKAQATGGLRSRFEIVSVRAPSHDIAIAHVRRVALDDPRAIEPPHGDDHVFSEMALYVLVRRDDSWWVAAGQNTPIRA